MRSIEDQLQQRELTGPFNNCLVYDIRTGISMKKLRIRSLTLYTLIDVLGTEFVIIFLLYQETVTLWVDLLTSRSLSWHGNATHGKIGNEWSMFSNCLTISVPLTKHKPVIDIPALQKLQLLLFLLAQATWITFTIHSTMNNAQIYQHWSLTLFSLHVEVVVLFPHQRRLCLSTGFTMIML